MSGVLVIAPHPDDEVLGVGGTLARLASEGVQTTVAVMTGPGELPHPIFQADGWDKVRAECRTAVEVLGVDRLIFRDDLPAALLDNVPGHKVNRAVEEVIREVRPETLYVPFAHDIQKDHQVIAHACALAARSYLEPGRSIHRVLAYEVLSETHLNNAYLHAPFEPNVYVDISEHLEIKLRALAEYASQLQPAPLPRSLAAVGAQAHMRGAAIGAQAAEGFLLLRETARMDHKCR